VRVLIAFAALLLLATFAPPSLERVHVPPAVTWIAYTPVRLNDAAPSQDRIGGLRFLGGWVLTSNDERFGGLSAIVASDDQMLAASDAGFALRFSLPTGATRVPATVFSTSRGSGKKEGDAEALAAAGDAVWLSYEHANVIRRLNAATLRPLAEAAPPAMSGWEKNEGPEAVVRLPDGRFIVFAEGSGGDSDALLFFGDPARKGTRTLRLSYRPPDGYRITDAAVLPDGRLIFVNRKFGLFDGFSTKLTVGRLPLVLREGGLIAGQLLADFSGAEQRDNFEGVSANREGGRTILWIVSDDNYLSLQRTMLMKFALEDAP
jgi:hypothetical protein